MYAKIASISLKVTEIQTNQVAKYAQIDRQLRLLTQIVQGLAAAPLRVVLGAANCTNFEFVREEEKTHQQCFINAPKHSRLCRLSTKMEFEGISQHGCLQGENEVERTSTPI
mmetsp:Transcript_26969/g.55804  ORF Transcript_26969/g.55804 Transcript_26969/m.55804 type:complete len:112 (-) Transcript_26969:215-550(-)